MEQPVSIVERRAEMAESLHVASSPGPLSNDVWSYRVSILMLGALGLLALGGALVLSAFGRETPQVAVALGSGAVGALAGLLTPTRS
ncbi:MAG: hypothetical protein M3336_10970 [Chloroflexota bacterium]|jgi:hypothetical protein|nr:hypothetical protein [Chloroflexota bacterium]